MSQAASAAPAITDKCEIRKEDIKRLKEVINEIEDDPKSYEFREPVPWRELGLNDYSDIIKKPMDLKSARNKLIKQKYSKYEDFFRDVQLIWDNCKTYNIAGSDIYKLAEEMEKISRRAMNRAREAIGITSKRVKKSVKGAGGEETKDAEMEE